MPNHIKQRRKELKLTQQTIADSVGSTKATIMKLEKGAMQLTESWMQRLAIPLQCKAEDLIAKQWPADVPIIGEISIEQGISFHHSPLDSNGVADSVKGNPLNVSFAPRPPDGEYRDIKALTVVDDAAEPFLSKGSIIYYAEVITQDFKRYHDALIVCELQDSGYYFGRLKQGDDYGKFNLLLLNGQKISDVSLHWCGQVVFCKPQ